MNELLAALKLADRACYDEIWRWALWMSVEEAGEYDPENLEFQKHVDDVVVGCVGRAITARPGWNWQVQTWNTTNLKLHIAYVTGDGIEEKAEASSPAKAILTCHLSAIEAQP